MYFIKSPWVLKKYYANCIWEIPTSENTLYLTFDDGPHPLATPFVLEKLKEYRAKATFFCIGKNVAQYPEIYQQILMDGHRVGNHTYDHVNGWKAEDEDYLASVLKAEKYIDSDLFRPPYGKITRFQIHLLTTPSAKAKKKFRIIMWDVLSGDFDAALTAEQCTRNVLQHSRKGSIVTFHDSEKAFPRMKIALEELLNQFSAKGFQFETIP